MTMKNIPEMWFPRELTMEEKCDAVKKNLNKQLLPKHCKQPDACSSSLTGKCVCPVPKKQKEIFHVSDIRNKLSPFKNLIKLLEHKLNSEPDNFSDLIHREIEECKKSIVYLSGN